MDYKKMMSDAASLEEAGQLTEAYNLYDQVYESIIKEAGDHAKNIPGSIVPKDGGRIITDKYFLEADKYMKDHPEIHLALYHLGQILIKQEEPLKAKGMLKRAIELTPDNQIFNEPVDLLKTID